MKTLTKALLVAVLFLFSNTVFAQFDEILRDAEEYINEGEKILNTGDRLKKKYIGETAEIDISNGFSTSTNFFVEATANSNRSKGDTVLSLFTSKSGVVAVPVFSDEGTNVNIVIKVYRLTEGEKEFLFSYQKEFFMNMNFRSTSHTVNESTSRTYMGNGKTNVLFVNHKKNVVSLIFFNNGSEQTKVLDPNEKVSVVFNNDATPFASFLIEEWEELESGEMTVRSSEEQSINFKDYLFKPFIIK